jgi:glycine/D-amino acid oxidase-like deaminating enzyme
MSEPVLDVLVVGGGVVGAMIFHQVAATGRSVALVERHRIASGTTGACGGVVRCYDNDETLAERALLGWRFYRGFGRSTGVHVPFVDCGFLYFPHRANAARARQLVANSAGAAPIRWLDADEVNRRFGKLLTDPGAGAVWEPAAGYLDAINVVRGLVRAGQDKGGWLFEGTAVYELQHNGGRTVVARTSGGLVKARRVVLAAGTGSPALLDACGIDHDLHLRLIQVDLRIPSGSVERHPAFLDETHDVNGREDPQSGGIYLGHSTGADTTDDVPTPVELAHTTRAERAGAHRFAWVAGSLARGGQRAGECFTRAPRPRIVPLDDGGSLLLATGFNGTGFRMAPWAASEVLRQIGSGTPNRTGGARDA